VVLSAGGANTYTWEPGTTVNSTVNAFPASTQVYTVTGTDANGCNGSSTISIIVSNCTGITSIAGAAVNYVVYPNPAKEKITLSITTDQILELTVELVDALGRSISKQNLTFSSNKTENQINISAVPNGVYFIKIYSKDGASETIRLLKE
jgi:hypothetical protein